MKIRLVLIIALAHMLISSSIFAQAPQKMSYQAVIRNTSGALITSTSVGMKISIIPSLEPGSIAVYSETQTASTNANGLVSIQIGTGTVVTGTFVGINWATGPYFIRIAIDPTGGTNYTIVSSDELMSVPYALFSVNGTPGPAGATGPQGIQGLTGATGAAGSDGTNGNDGATGPIGLTGAAGTNGNDGATGSTGNDGTNGIDGATGATGAAGSDGTNGNDGATGATGAAGTNGTNGAVGATGATGAAGTNGTNGAVGTTGSQGTQGIQGATGTFTSGTVAGQMNYWNGTAWVTVAPGTYGQNLTYCNGFPTWGPCPPLVIGQSHQGGIIAYILQAGDLGYNANVQHGLIATPSDQNFYGAGPGWGCYGTTITGADGIAIGTGNQNTIDIMNGCSTAGIAARICGDLVLGGYSDWYLPSKDELYQLCLNRVAIGGFANSNNYYCSSSEKDALAVFMFMFDNNTINQGWSDKNIPYGVRAVRAF